MGDRIRILLVDDHAMVRRGIRDFLEATAKLLPGVVIMDLLMPGMDGIAATAEIGPGR